MVKTKKESKKMRLSIPLSEHIYNLIEIEANKIGISMSAYAAYLIGESINQKTQAYKMLMSEVTGQVGKKISEMPMNEEGTKKLLEDIRNLKLPIK